MILLHSPDRLGTQYLVQAGLRLTTKSMLTSNSSRFCLSRTELTGMCVSNRVLSPQPESPPRNRLWILMCSWGAVGLCLQPPAQMV